MSYICTEIISIKKKRKIKMKKLVFVAFAMFAMAFASCGGKQTCPEVEADTLAVDTTVVDSTLVDTTNVDTVVAE